MRLAHQWELVRGPGFSQALLAGFIRPAVRAVPSALARRLGRCHISSLGAAGPAVTSQWTETSAGLEIALATADTEEHDVALELLLCLGQALWHRLAAGESRAWWSLLEREIGEGVTGEIDEHALDRKRALAASRVSARSRERLESYGAASFAGSAAEFVHCLWHQVTVCSGSAYLPGPYLRRRLDLLARWFPPDRGYRLYPGR